MLHLKHASQPRILPSQPPPLLLKLIARAAILPPSPRLLGILYRLDLPRLQWSQLIPQPFDLGPLGGQIRPE